ncbi:MAG: PEP-CTERM sorting domain-containing protein [Verrucomicrobiota bacterium]
MKKQLLAGLLGFLALGPSAFAQGELFFDNYNNHNPGWGADNEGYGSPVMWMAQMPIGGQRVDASYGFTFHIFYALGTVTDPSLITKVPASGGTTTIEPWAPGFFYPTTIILSDYVSGPVSFVVTATGTPELPLFGISMPWTMSSIATGITLPGPLDGMQSFEVGWVPEPTTASLSLLGAAAWAVSKRRQANRV